MPSSKSEVLQGTLDLRVPKTLDSMGPMDGFGIAMRIQQVSVEEPESWDRMFAMINRVLRTS